MMVNIGHAMGRAQDGLDDRREAVAELLAELSEQVAMLAPLDTRRILPLGYATVARRP
jgi:hypothetical protein